MPENNPPEAALLQDRQEIEKELARLREALVRSERTSLANCSEGLLLVRLCAGLTLQDWDRIVEEGHFHHWLGLPAMGDSAPHLSRIQRTIEELAHLTSHDPLTGLANRRAFERTLRMELERSVRSGTPLSLVLLDLDNFKSINDSFGHNCGDRVLTAMAGALFGNKRLYDLAARVGGEEFALILPGSGLGQADGIAERLLAEIRQLRVTCEGVDDPVSFTCSAGLVCTRGRTPLSVERFVDLADKALYEAKAQGKDRVVNAPTPDLLDASQTTLVHAEEKQFLFTGPDT